MAQLIKKTRRFGNITIIGIYIKKQNLYMYYNNTVLEVTAAFCREQLHYSDYVRTIFLVRVDGKNQ